MFARLTERRRKRYDVVALRGEEGEKDEENRRISSETRFESSLLNLPKETPRIRDEPAGNIFLTSTTFFSCMLTRNRAINQCTVSAETAGSTAAAEQKGVPRSWGEEQRSSLHPSTHAGMTYVCCSRRRRISPYVFARATRVAYQV